jgi:hypothetical protein
MGVTPRGESSGARRASGGAEAPGEIAESTSAPTLRLRLHGPTAWPPGRRLRFGASGRFWTSTELETLVFRGANELLLRALTLLLALGSLGCPQLSSDDFSTERRPGVDASSPPLGHGPDASPFMRDAADCAPLAVCEGACVDVQSDALHCGDCDGVIGTDQICSDGRSVSAATGCGMRSLCGRGCVDIKANPLHCGACGVACKLGARCMMSRCQCPPGTKDCGSECRQCCLDADCPMDRACLDGRCELVCTAPSVACGARCATLSTDPMHCGRCGNNCGPTGICTGGACSAL